MGSVEIDQNRLLIHSNIITYGNGANTALSEMMRDEIETMWNEPKGLITIHGKKYFVAFSITASFQPVVTDLDIYQNLDPRNNYFRIEEFAHTHISFVDGLGCNTGYFKVENLYKGSTTAAHEYGHTLGLDHPSNLDIRGEGVPGIMYPRGTLVDAEYQYEPDKPAGTKGGTLYPIYRKVLQSDIDNLDLHRLDFENGRAVLGEFTNVWHPDHSTPGSGDYLV
jgi:hypothetical protein